MTPAISPLVHACALTAARVEAQAELAALVGCQVSVLTRDVESLTARVREATAREHAAWDALKARVGVQP